MTDKHIDGPWAAERSLPQEGCDGWWLRDNHQRDIGWINGGDHNEHIALLAAAAPDLLAALEKLIDAFDRSEKGFPLPVEARFNVMEFAQSAIAKAKGQTK